MHAHTLIHTHTHTYTHTHSHTYKHTGTNAIHGVQNVKCLVNGSCPTSFPAPCALAATFNMTNVPEEMKAAMGASLAQIERERRAADFEAKRAIAIRDEAIERREREAKRAAALDTTPAAIPKNGGWQVDMFGIRRGKYDGVVCGYIGPRLCTTEHFHDPTVFISEHLATGE